MERHELAAFSSPVAGKAVRAAFDGGRLTSDAGVLLLAGSSAGSDRRAPGALPRGPAVAGAGAPHDGRDDPLPRPADRGRLPGRERLRRARADPAFKMAGRPAPESGADLCSQPTMCRLENLPRPPRSSG
jgi:hypothetical protein